MAEGSDKARTEGGLKSEFPASPPESGTIAKANETENLVALDADGPGPDADFLAGELRKRVVGQDEAVDQVAAFYQQSQAGLSPPDRPVGSFLFLGPTGSGKTRTVEALAEVLAKNPRAVIKIDCGEFQHSHEIAKPRSNQRPAAVACPRHVAAESKLQQRRKHIQERHQLQNHRQRKHGLERFLHPARSIKIDDDQYQRHH